MVVLGTVLGLVLHRKLPLALIVPWLRMMAPGLAREARTNGPAAAARLAGLILYHAIGNLAVLTVASARYRRLVL
jgi:hypothetical protein